MTKNDHLDRAEKLLDQSENHSGSVEYSTLKALQAIAHLLMAWHQGLQ